MVQLFSCLVPRRLSRCARKGRREGDSRLYPSHGPLRFITSHSFRARLCHAKNEAPEEEADSFPYLETRGREALQIFLRDGGESRIV